MSLIRMGNDEFILHIRKNSKSIRTNEVLGRLIWDWIRKKDTNAKEVIKSEACRWGNTGSFIADNNLPQTATQFEFDISILPDLYIFLLTL